MTVLPTISAVDTAKLVRSELKSAYPDVKFRVRTHSRVASPWVDVDWVDGPTVDDVDTVLDAIDGNPDYQNASIFTQRYFSRETYDNIFAQMEELNPDRDILRDGYPNKHYPFEYMEILNTGSYDIKGAVSLDTAAYNIASQVANPKELVLA